VTLDIVVIVCSQIGPELRSLSVDVLDLIPLDRSANVMKSARNRNRNRLMITGVGFHIGRSRVGQYRDASSRCSGFLLGWPFSVKHSQSQLATRLTISLNPGPDELNERQLQKGTRLAIFSSHDSEVFTRLRTRCR
jgi:hypothetical protein